MEFLFKFIEEKEQVEDLVVHNLDLIEEKENNINMST
jgi:hypothetical protein